MLSILRKHAGSWFIKFILAFIALTFVWWGVGTYSERERELAATVGSTRITMSELGEAVAGLEKAYRDVYGNAFTPEMAKALDLRRQALDGLVQRALFLAEAKKMGIVARKAEVQREIAANPAFQVDGQFREDRYLGILSNNRVSPGEYEAAKQDEITLRKMEGLLTASSRVSPEEAREYFDLSYRKIRLLVVAADPAAIRNLPQPTEEEIVANYEQKKETYRIPARVKLSVARFDPDFFARKAEASEEEIRSFHEGNADRFRTEESRLLSNILLPYSEKNRDAVLTKAGEILSEANQGREQFDALAKRHPFGKAKGEWFTRRDLRPEVAEAAFSTGVDSVAGPVDVGRGFLLVRVNQIRFPESLPLAKVREQVVSLLKREKGKDLAVLRAYEAHGKAMESQDLAGSCAPYGIAPAETGWLSGDTSGDLPPQVFQEALLLRTGEIGPVKTVGDAHYLFRVSAKEESRIPALDTVRERVRQTIMAARREAEARSGLEKALAGAKTAAELERNAKQGGWIVGSTSYFLPLSGDLPGALAGAGEIRRDLLGLSPANPVSPKIFRSGQLFLAVALLGEQPPGAKEWETGMHAFTTELVERKKTELIGAFLEERKKTAKVEIQPQALQ